MYFLSRYEQETTINFNAGDDKASCYTADPRYIRKFDALVQKNPEQFVCIDEGRMDGRVISKTYEFPKRFLCIHSMDSPKREYTPEERKDFAERMKYYREKAKMAKNKEE